MRSKQATTMSDVAREAGVALGTVSKVLNGRPVGEEYRLKVEAAVKKLDYQINPSAKALKSNRSGFIALIIPDTTTPFFALLTQYVNLSLEKRGYKMMLCFTGRDSVREQEFIRMVHRHQADGIIALTYTPDLQIPAGIPFVTIDRFFSVDVPCIASDNFGGGRLAAQKLAELGCKRLACLRIGSSLVNEPSKRKDGFVSGCMELGLPFEMCNLPDGVPLSAFEVFLKKNILESDQPVDGIFCGNDLQAWQVINILHHLGCRVPEDVQVIGFDGTRMFGNQDYICSTIVQPVPDLAETAVNMVLSNDFKGLPPLICLPVRYQPGGTTRDSANKAEA